MPTCRAPVAVGEVAHQNAAARVDGPAADTFRTRVGTVPVPTPTPDDVLIRVTHAGINFKDVMMRRSDPGYVPAWPVVPGLEVTGEIVRVGDDVRDLVAGTRVAALTNTGGLAEYVVAREALTVRVPDGVPPEIAAVVPGVLSTAWLLLHEAARVRAGDTILVHSASGAVGTAIAAIAATIKKTRLLGAVGSPRRIEDATLAGYPHAFVRDEHLVDAVRSSTGERGVDIVLDPQGTTWLEPDLRMLAPAGRIVLFGNASGAPLDPVDAGRLYATNGAVGGFSIGGLSGTAPTLVRSAMEAVLDLISDSDITRPAQPSHRGSARPRCVSRALLTAVRKRSMSSSSQPDLLTGVQQSPLSVRKPKGRFFAPSGGIRADRVPILEQSHSQPEPADVRRICDLFGIGIESANRYAATLGRPGFREQMPSPRTRTLD